MEEAQKKHRALLGHRNRCRHPRGNRGCLHKDSRHERRGNKKNSCIGFQDFLPIIMFGTLAFCFFRIPGGFHPWRHCLSFGMIGYWIDMFDLIEFFNFLPRIWFQGAENPVLVAVPAFVFMGVMMERSGVANDLLYCVQVLLKKWPVPSLGVIVMGTGVGCKDRDYRALVTMMTALALPKMIKQGYKNSLSCG
ncbi:MAG: hypothetical protein CM1200mP41_06710 [Gammaproteobacteria bacterium]|nr:MAG: hypothetical protein CM1200mP41_06710 [Gammaproteobacteria bacterium]